jgi:hypothetical protein
MAISRRCVVTGLLGSLMTAAQAAANEIARSNSGAIALASGSIRVALHATKADISGVLAEPAGRRFSLLFSGLATNKPPGTNYLVFLNVPEGATPDVQDAGFAGTISFFGASAAAESSRAVSFEVSGVLQRLRALGRLADGLIVTIAAAGKPQPDSRPTIDRIAMFED